MDINHELDGIVSLGDVLLQDFCNGDLNVDNFLNGLTYDEGLEVVKQLFDATTSTPWECKNDVQQLAHLKITNYFISLSDG